VSKRYDILAGIVTLISSSPSLAGVPVSIWSGDVELFNRLDVVPAIFVSYDGAVAGEDEELEGAVTYSETFFYAVHVAANSATSALAYLEAIESVCMGSVIDGFGRIFAARFDNVHYGKSEILIASRDDLVLYAQSWGVEVVISKTS